MCFEARCQELPFLFHQRMKNDGRLLGSGLLVVWVMPFFFCARVGHGGASERMPQIHASIRSASVFAFRGVDNVSRGGVADETAIAAGKVGQRSRLRTATRQWLYRRKVLLQCLNGGGARLDHGRGEGEKHFGLGFEAKLRDESPSARGRRKETSLADAGHEDEINAEGREQDEDLNHTAICEACSLGRANEGIADEWGMWMLWLCEGCAADYTRNVSNLAPLHGSELCNGKSAHVHVGASMGNVKSSKGSEAARANMATAAADGGTQPAQDGTDQVAVGWTENKIGQKEGEGGGGRFGKAGRPLMLNRRCFRCAKYAIFGSVGSGRPVACARHRKESQVDVMHAKCGARGCKTTASYAAAGATWRAAGARRRAVWCSKHRPQNASAVAVVPRRVCAYPPGCNKWPVFGEAGGGSALYCAAHKRASDADVVNRRCQAQACRRAASYGSLEAGVMRFCRAHAPAGSALLRLRRKLCVGAAGGGGCTRQAHYRSPNSSVAILCRLHRRRLDVPQRRSPASSLVMPLCPGLRPLALPCRLSLPPLATPPPPPPPPPPRTLPPSAKATCACGYDAWLTADVWAGYQQTSRARCQVDGCRGACSAAATPACTCLPLASPGLACAWSCAVDAAPCARKAPGWQAALAGLE